MVFLDLTISAADITRPAATERLLFGPTIRLTGSVFRIPMDFWRPDIMEQIPARASVLRACRLQVLRLPVLRVQVVWLRTDGISEAAIPRRLRRHRRRGGDSSPATGWRKATIAPGRRLTGRASNRTAAVLHGTTVATQAECPSRRPLASATPLRSTELRSRCRISRRRGCHPSNTFLCRGFHPRAPPPRISLRHADLPTSPHRVPRVADTRAAGIRAKARANTEPHVGW